MTRSIKTMFGLSLLLLILSYPTCQIGEKRVHEEMAKYSPEFVEAHYFDMVFLRYALAGIYLFFGGTGLALLAVILWITKPKNRRGEHGQT